MRRTAVILVALAATLALSTPVLAAPAAVLPPSTSTGQMLLSARSGEPTSTVPASTRTSSLTPVRVPAGWPSRVGTSTGRRWRHREGQPQRHRRRPGLHQPHRDGCSALGSGCLRWAHLLGRLLRQWGFDRAGRPRRHRVDPKFITGLNSAPVRAGRSLWRSALGTSTGGTGHRACP